MRLVLIVLAGMVLAACSNANGSGQAVAASRFDLDCHLADVGSGQPLSRRYSVDLDAKLYCEDPFCREGPSTEIKSVSEQELVLADGNAQRIVIDRVTGGIQLVAFDREGGSDTLRGSCERAEYQSAPATKF